MTKYIIKRTLQSLITIFIVVSFVFICLRLPFMTNRGRHSAPPINEMVGMLWGFWKQLLTTGSLGPSSKYVGSTIEQVLIRRSGYTFTLALGITITSYAMGIPLGVLYAKRKRKWLNAVEYIHNTFVRAIPEVVIYSAFQFYFARRLGLAVYYNPDNVFSWLAPIIIGSFVLIAHVSFFVKRYMVDELNSNYVGMAKAKGLSDNTIFYKHIFKNILVHLVRNIADTFFIIITTAWFLEIIYAIPGISELFFISLHGLKPDLPIGKDVDFTQATVFAFTAISVFILLISDIIVKIIDPRIGDY